MLCRHCGMESRTSGTCEWCHKPLASQATNGVGVGARVARPPDVRPLTGVRPLTDARPLTETGAERVDAAFDRTQAIDPPAAPPRRVALTGEVVEAPPPAPAAAMPTVGVLQAAGGLYGVAPLPSRAVLAETVALEARRERAGLGERWELSLAICLPMLIVAMVLVHFAPAAFLWAALAVLFLVGLALGATGAIGPYEEAFADCSGVLIVSFLLGPVIGLAAYLVTGLIKQEWNAAINFTLIAHIVVRFLLAVAFASSADALTLVPQLSFIPGAGFLAVCCSFAGWILSSFFRPLDE